VSEVKKWIGDAPTECDVCHNYIDTDFVDGRSKWGSWANMCLACHSMVGVGLGTGMGQRYERMGDEWIKVEG
jgi:hypothetical protein